MIRSHGTVRVAELSLTAVLPELIIKIITYSLKVTCLIFKYIISYPSPTNKKFSDKISNKTWPHPITVKFFGRAKCRIFGMNDKHDKVCQQKAPESAQGCPDMNGKIPEWFCRWRSKISSFRLSFHEGCDRG